MHRWTALTTRGRTVLVLLVVLVLSGAGIGGVIASKTIFSRDCRVEVSGRTTALGRDDAVRIGTAAAKAVRRGSSVLAAVEAVSGLSGDAARDVALAVSGNARAALTCTGGGADDTEPDSLSSEGLTARAERVRVDMELKFGHLPLGGFAPGGVHSGHMPGSAHYEGRAIDIFFRPITTRDKTRGWALAQYLVANAERLEINTVIFDGRIWSARHSSAGWRAYTVSNANRSAATIAILEHRDHVHVDVAD